jgi:hypothetical protein
MFWTCSIKYKGRVDFFGQNYGDVIDWFSIVLRPAQENLIV